MKLSTWRPKLMLWLSKNIVVDSWALDRPETVATTMGFLPPLRDVSYRMESFKECQMTATQDFYVLKRLPADYTYRELPLATLEGLYTTLAIRLVQGHTNIDPDVLELEYNPVDQPIKVSELGEDEGDWLAEVRWAFTVTLSAEPEEGGMLKPFSVNQLTLNTYKDGFEDDLTDGVSQPELRRLDSIIVKP